MKDEDDKGCPHAAAATGDVTRRKLLVWLGALPGVIAGIATAIPLLGYLLNPLIHNKKDQWVDVGPEESFQRNTTRLVKFHNPLAGGWDGKSARGAAYVRRLNDGSFEVLSVHCTHLGCPVKWLKEAGLFLCPCHGGVYYADGSRASGPPPRGLYHLPHRRSGGRLYIRFGHLPLLQEPA